MNFFFLLNDQHQPILPPPAPYPFHNPYLPPLLSSPFGLPHPIYPQQSGVYSSYPLPPHSPQFSARNLALGGLRQSSEVQIEKAGRQVTIRKKREKNSEKETMSAKKNSESNLINHFFIFFTTKQCSEGEVGRIVKQVGKDSANLEKKVSIFCNLMKVINLNRGKKYMNKHILLKYFTEEGLQERIPETLAKIQLTGIFTVPELVQMLRKSFYYFIRSASLISILTSKRISILSKSIHLERRTKILQDFENKFP